MAHIAKEIQIDAAPDAVWDAVRDVGRVHRRLVPGITTDCRLEDGARVVTFANGMVLRELIVDVDQAARRRTTMRRCRCSSRPVAAAGWSGWPISCPIR
jgi:hypothetical protein